MKEYSVAIRYEDGAVHKYEVEAISIASAALKTSQHRREFGGELVFVGELPYVQERDKLAEAEMAHPELPWDGSMLPPPPACLVV